MKIAIVGAGKLGQKITEALLGGDHSVTVIDKRAEALHDVTMHMDVMAVHANAKQISLLKDIKIGSYDYLIATADSDEKNMLIASFAKKLGCPRVIARVRDPEHAHQLDFIKETMSIDYIVNPDLAITAEIYKYLVEKCTLTNGIFSSGNASLLEFSTSKMPKLIGMEMTDFKRLFPDMLVVALSRSGKVIIPNGKTVIRSGDGLYVIGMKGPIMSLSSRVHEKSRYTGIRRVMIIGGGKTGLYLASELSEFGVSVKIVEKDKARCHYLAAHLTNVMVLHGDASDTELLEEEGVADMDAFIAATGFDEDNLLLALIAKNYGVEDVIAKISRDSYIDLIGNMGVNMVLNPLDITTSHILRYVQGSKHVISSQLIQGQAELIEIYATSHMKLLNKPLKHMDLPEGILFAAIHRGGGVIIPDGNTVIREGDRVLLICLLTEIPELEKLLKPSTKVRLF
ncbi:MAG: Trk system potassium transporter TrkA [Kiritimatiellaeota bacterium]|nr:Trk system potassium transporter TrkA [Kiritimatiellota bacterium]